MSTSQCKACTYLPLRTLLVTFFVLSFLGLLNVFITSMTRSPVEVSMSPKPAISNIIKEIKEEVINISNARKEECDNCFKHDFRYILNNPNICQLYPGQTTIEILILILTVHNNTDERSAIRETWLTYSKNNSASVRYAFLLGKIQNTDTQELLRKESEHFGDILQEDFMDAYGNLTYKTLMGFKWTATYCRVANTVLKTDDDMYINVPKVLEIVREHLILLQTNIFGLCSQVAIPIRDRTSKWYASFESYPGKSYAGYCSGTGYLTSLNVVRKVFEVSHNVPFFHLEDVYVALCIKKIGYHLKDYPGFNQLRPKLNPCVYNGDSLVTAHFMTPNTTRQMWTTKCDPLSMDSTARISTTSIYDLSVLLTILYVELL